MFPPRSTMMWDCSCPPSDCAGDRSKALAGDRDSGEAILDRFVPLISAIVARTLGPAFESERDDAVQATLIRITRYMGKWRGEKPFCHWVKSVAANTALTQRARAATVRSRFVPLADLDKTGPATQVLSLERRECIQRVYESLPTECQTVYDLKLSGLTMEEIAARIQKSVRTVHTRLNEVRRSLSVCLA